MTNLSALLRRYLLRRDFLSRSKDKLRHYFRYGSRDAFVAQSILFSYIKVGTVIDVGANMGNTVAKYLHLFPNTTIYAFEPTPSVCEQLKTKFKTAENVQVYQKGIGETDGEVTFYTDKTHPNMNSIFRPNDLNWVTNPTRISIEMLSLDTFCSIQNVQDIHILKIDIQGGELAALRGAIGLFSKQSIWCVYLECQLQPLYVGQPLIYELFDFMHEYGYTVFNFYNFHETPFGQATWCDVIFVSPKLQHLLSTKS